MLKPIFTLIMLIMPSMLLAYEIKEGAPLSLKEAISIALNRHPEIKAAEGNVEIGISRVGQAESGYYPSISINSALSRYSLPQGGSDSNFTASLNLSQNIYDFGKREGKLDIERLNLGYYEHDLGSTKALVVFNIKKAYYAAFQAKSALNVAKEVVRQYEEHLKRARGFYETGLKPKYEVTKAEADLANAKVNMLKAENGLKIAMVSLKNAIAMPEAADFDLQDGPIKVWPELSLDPLVQRAMATRQDLQSLLQKFKAQKRKIDYEKTGYYPTITGNLGYGVSGDRMPFNKSWNIGASLTIPLFSGFLTKYQIKEAEAALLVLHSQIEALRQKIALEVKQAYLNALEARQRIEAAQASVSYAGQNLELARGRYNVGIGNPIEVADALTVYANAQNTYIAAQYDYSVALAELERATGGQLFTN